MVMSLHCHMLHESRFDLWPTVGQGAASYWPEITTLFRIT